MRLDLDDPAFAAMVVDWLRGLSDDVLRDPAAVLEESPGVYPSTLLALWRDEVRRRGLTLPAEPAPPLPAERNVSLPVGHPVDADWRFTPETAAELANLALDSASPGDAIAHVGTPSTFLRCVLTHADYRHVLLDRNVAVLDALAARGIGAPHIMVGVDFATVRRLHLQAAAAIVDPPWYLDDTYLFLSVAAQLCRPNATILLCQPAFGTRPGVETERVALSDDLPGLGLALHAVRSGAVRYVTPHFEEISLRAAVGGAKIPTSWRRGDMLVLERVGEPVRATRRLSSVEPHWHEASFGPVRIKLAEHATGPDLGELVSGDVLPTVSRRDPRRPRIGLWTSGNRVFTLNDPQTIGELIELCNTDLMSHSFSLESTLQHAHDLGISDAVAQKLFAVLQAELQEHNEWGSRYE